MNNSILVNSIKSIIPGGISIKDFSVVAEIDEQNAKKILDEIVQINIGKMDEGNYNFAPSDRLKFALFAIKKGVPVEEISEHIDWKDFEGLVAEILEEKGFATIRNMMLTKPRMEIDVVGINLGVAMLIDCKHWKRTSSSAINNVVEKQVERTKHYVSQTHGAIAVPVIVTLHQENVNFVNRVPIVPILQFSSFVDEFYGNLEQMDVIK